MLLNLYIPPLIKFCSLHNVFSDIGIYRIENSLFAERRTHVQCYCLLILISQKSISGGEIHE